MEKLIKRFLITSLIVVSTFFIACSNSDTSKQLEDLNSAFSKYEIDKAIKILNDNKENEEFKDECLLIINNYVKKYKLKYETKEIDDDTYIKINELAYEFTNDESYNEIIKNVEDNKKNMALYDEAIKLINEEKYLEAFNKLNSIDSSYENYNKVTELINEYSQKVKESMVNEVNNYVNNKEFNLAIEKVNELSTLFPSDDKITAFKSEVTKYYDDYKKNEEINNQILENKRKEEEAYNKAYEKIFEACKKSGINQGAYDNVTLTYDGIFVLDGKEYYSFLETTGDGLGSDAKKLVRKSDYSMYNYYANGALFPIYEDGTVGSQITSPSNPIEITIGELCKNYGKYQSQYVRITGIINYINESLPMNDMILVNDRMEYVYISYSDDTSYLKGDVVTMIGLVNSTTSNFSANGIQITMPKIELGEVYYRE